MRLKQLLHALKTVASCARSTESLLFRNANKGDRIFFFHLVQQKALREEIVSEKAHVENPRRATRKVTRKPIQAIFYTETLCRFAINPYLCTRFCERANYFGA